MQDSLLPWSKLAPANGPGTPLTSVNAVVGPDGSFVGQFLRMDTGEIVKVEFAPSGQYSLLQVQGDRWREAAVSLKPGPRARGSSLTVQTARSTEDGAVEATTTTTALKGHQVTRTLQLQKDGSWSSDYQSVRPGGQRVTGQASSGGQPGAEILQKRQKYDPNGDLAWTVDIASRPVATRTNLGNAVRGGTTASAMLGAIKAWYLGGGNGDGTLFTYDPTIPESSDGRIFQRWVIHTPDADRERTAVLGPGLEETITDVTRFHNGEIWVYSEKSELFWDGPLLNVKSSETWGVRNHVDGTKTTWHETYKFGGDESRPDIDPGGEVGRFFHTDTWEKSTAAPDGSITVERGAKTTSAAGESETVIHTRPDGTRTMTTTTTDNDGHGSRHTTVYDSQGRTVSDKTEDVGPGSGSSSGSSSGGSTGGGASGGDSSDNTPPPDDGDGGDDGAPLGEEGGPGAGSWGGRGHGEGPLGLLPKHAGGAFGSTIIIDDPLADPEHDSYNAVPARMVAGLTYDALVNPGVAYGSRGDEQGGSKGAPAPRTTSRGTTFLGVVEIPPEEAVQWDNPEVHFTFLAETISALKQTSGIDGASLDAAERAARELGAFSARFSAQK